MSIQYNLHILFHIQKRIQTLQVVFQSIVFLKAPQYYDKSYNTLLTTYDIKRKFTLLFYVFCSTMYIILGPPLYIKVIYV